MSATTTEEPMLINITVETIDQNSLFNGAQQILSVIRPHWHKNINYKLITGGITNALVSCQQEDDTKQEDVILVRIYGQKTELLIDRDQEKRNILFLHKAGIAPPLYATFQNGLVYKFIRGCTLSQKTVTQPKIYKLVAAHLAKLHRTKISNGCDISPVLWDKCQQFLELIPEEYSDLEKQVKFRRCFPGKEVIAREIQEMRCNLDSGNCKIVFAHNDLLLGNIIYNEEESRVTFIDFEYVAPNYASFDIGNHFAEFIGTENIDLDNYPSKELQLDWIREYLQVLNDPEPVTKDEIEKLYVEVNKFSLMSHLFWGVWSFIQAQHSKIDFDFIEYGSLRLREYFKKKSAILSLGKTQI